VISRLNAETLKALKLPDVQKRLIDSGSDIIGNSPEQADQFLRSELEKWGKVVRAANVKPN
jgi:tripartite-type tricarboxylate transporter receptor subunit TctC